MDILFTTLRIRIEKLKYMNHNGDVTCEMGAYGLG